MNERLLVDAVASARGVGADDTGAGRLHGGGDMDTPDPSAADARGETEAQRADRNFSEVVQELRVSQTGVQILFAFLLSLSFMNAFPGTDPTFRWVLAAALLTAAGATICFIAPVATHRLQFRQGRKENIVWVAHRMAAAGLVLLITSMTLSVWLVIAHLWDASTPATIVAVAMVLVAVLVWVVLPLVWVGRPPADERSADERSAADT